jgi:hypothetical protein
MPQKMGEYHRKSDVCFWPLAVIDDVEKLENSIAAFCRLAELQLLILRIAASGQERLLACYDG